MSEPVRARQKVALIDRFQEHQDRPLRHLVFERRDTKRTLRAIRLRDVVPAHRGRTVAARFVYNPVQKEPLDALMFVKGSTEVRVARR